MVFHYTLYFLLTILHRDAFAKGKKYGKADTHVYLVLKINIIEVVPKSLQILV